MHVKVYKYKTAVCSYLCACICANILNELQAYNLAIADTYNFMFRLYKNI